MEKRKMNKFPVLIGVLMLASIGLSAQCNIQSADQGSGFTTYYLDPELVAQDSEFGLALSVQMVADKYYLALTYRFGRIAQPLEEKVALELVNGYTLELEMYTMQVGNAGGVELCMAVYNIEDEVLPYFKSSDLKVIHFRTQDGKKHSMTVGENKGVLKRQLRCFGI